MQCASLCYGPVNHCFSLSHTRTHTNNHISICNRSISAALTAASVKQSTALHSPFIHTSTHSTHTHTLYTIVTDSSSKLCNHSLQWAGAQSCVAQLQPIQLMGQVQLQVPPQAYVIHNSQAGHKCWLLAVCSCLMLRKLPHMPKIHTVLCICPALVATPPIAASAVASCMQRFNRKSETDTSTKKMLTINKKIIYK